MRWDSRPNDPLSVIPLYNIFVNERRYMSNVGFPTLYTNNEDNESVGGDDPDMYEIEEVLHGIP